MLDGVLVERGLRELNPDIHFDLGGRHNIEHPYAVTRQGVFYRDKHLCSMDRGMLPEYKIWATQKRLVELPWFAADREDASISWTEVLPTEPGYMDLRILGEKELDPQYMIRKTDGKLLRCKVMGYEPVGRRCMRVGWRHTFERILANEIPGVTRKAIAEKFGVDMDKFPAGSPDELVAALVEE